VLLLEFLKPRALKPRIPRRSGKLAHDFGLGSRGRLCWSIRTSRTQICVKGREIRPMAHSF
jgi:hypothetical protein